MDAETGAAGRAGRRVPPFRFLVVLLLALYAFGALGLTRLARLPWFMPIPVPAGAAAGAALLAAGVWLYAAALRTLGARRALGGEIGLPGSAGRLVTGGIYARTRNPLYLAALLMLLGALLATRLTPLVFLTGLLAIHFPVVAKWEERELARRFGAEFEEYRRRVPFLLPRLR
jgi:protein-S-isoprenylcysteine O-methyltransferase Ste14